MATLSIVNWREDPVGFTGWDGHLNSELKKRLKRAIAGSPADLRQAARNIEARRLFTLCRVKNGELARVRQILETMGAEVVATLGDSE
jgi:hypothetical protein